VLDLERTTGPRVLARIPGPPSVDAVAGPGASIPHATEFGSLILAAPDLDDNGTSDVIVSDQETSIAIYLDPSGAALGRPRGVAYAGACHIARVDPDRAWVDVLVGRPRRDDRAGAMALDRIALGVVGLPSLEPSNGRATAAPPLDPSW